MSIEWPAPSGPSSMSVFTHDNTDAPSDVLDADKDFDVHVQWTVPASFASLMPGHDFRIRVFAESIGNGQEQQIGDTVSVPGSSGTNYVAHVKIPARTLRGEGEATSGGRSSGVYKLLAVLQHRNGASSATTISGFAESRLIQLRTP